MTGFLSGLGKRRRRAGGDPDGGAGLTPQDHADLASWLARDDDAAWDAADPASRRPLPLRDHPDVLKLRRDAQAYRAVWSPANKVLAGGLAAAAVLTVAVMIGMNGWAARGRTVRYATAVGERRVVTLQDRSVVTLDTASIVEVGYSANRRSLRLLSGRALFSVAKDKHRPFVVTAHGQTVTAVGTRFEVDVEHPGDTHVALFEGRVKVKPARAPGLAGLIPSFTENDLTPGEELSVSDGRPSEISHPDLSNRLMWMQGQLLFRNERLADAVAALNRYSTTPITLSGAASADLRISGVFNVGHDMEFASAVAAMHPLVIEETARGIALRPAR